MPNFDAVVTRLKSRAADYALHRAFQPPAPVPPLGRRPGFRELHRGGDGHDERRRPQAAAQEGLLSWGEHLFSAAAGYASRRRTTEYRHPAIERLGLGPQRQSTGPGADTLTLEGVVCPAWAGGPSAVEALRASAADGSPRLLLDGLGRALGRWAVVRVDETWSALHADGQPRKVSWSLELAYVDGAPGGERRDLAEAAAEAGDVAGVIDAVSGAANPAAAVADATAAAAGASGLRRVLQAVAGAASGGLPAMRSAALSTAARLAGERLSALPAPNVAYRASAGDVLDEIAWRQYGVESAVHDLLAANPGVAALPPALPAGALVGLPRRVAPSAEARAVTQLWD